MLVIGWELDWGAALRPPAALGIRTAPKPVSLALLPLVADKGGIVAFSETIARPLLIPTRQPAPPAAPVQAKAQMQRGQFVLVGTSITNGKSYAFLREVSGAKVIRVAQGEHLKGLMVDKIDAMQVVLRQDDETEIIPLRTIIPPRQPSNRGGVVAPGQFPPPPVSAGQAVPPTAIQKAGQPTGAAVDRQPSMGAAQPPGPARAETGTTVVKDGASWDAVFERMRQGRR
jgi:hypothetical protein